MSIKQVLVYRADLHMRKGKIAAQCAHASMKVFFDRMDPLERGVLCVELWPEAIEWVGGTFTKIVLCVESPEDLLALHRAARDAGLPCALITDLGATEFHGVPTDTAIAIGPADASRIDLITRDGPVRTKLA